MYTDKQETLNWYNKWTSFKKISPGHTYAQTLIKNSDRKWVIVIDENALFASKVKKNLLVNRSRIQESVKTHRPKFVQYASKGQVRRWRGRYELSGD